MRSSSPPARPRAINLVSYAWAAPRLQPGDEIVLSIMEHHANIVPWHFLRERQGVVLKWVEVDANGDLDPQAVLDAIGPRTKLVAVTHMSNVLGTVVDVAAICRGRARKGVPVLVDGSQAAVHMPVDVQAIGCDFYAITGHKLYGPSGSGAIFIRRERHGRDAPLPRRRRHDPRGDARRRHLERPADEVRGRHPRHRAADRPGRGAGLSDRAWAWPISPRMNATLRDYARDRLAGLNWLNVQGNSASKGAIFSLHAATAPPMRMTSRPCSTSAASRCARARIAPCR